MSDTKPPIANIDDVLATPEFSDTNPKRGRFQASFGFIGAALQTEGIGINVTRVPPGQKAWPKHYHFIGHEMFVVLSGAGTLHYGDDAHPIKSRDVIFIRAGTGIPFQLENTGEEELEYLALSTMPPADLFHYVDADKHGFMANGAPLRGAMQDGLPKFSRWVSPDMAVGYWEGEPEAKD